MFLWETIHKMPCLNSSISIFILSSKHVWRTENIAYILKKVSNSFTISRKLFFLYLNYSINFHYIFVLKLGCFFPEKSAVKNMRSLIVILMFIYPWPVCSLSKFTLFLTSPSIILWFWWIVKIHLEKVSSILIFWHNIYVCLTIEIKS